MVRLRIFQGLVILIQQLGSLLIYNILPILQILLGYQPHLLAHTKTKKKQQQPTDTKINNKKKQPIKNIMINLIPSSHKNCPPNFPKQQPATFLIKIHITKEQQVQICLSSNSNIDHVINDCIVKYRLKKEAHGFIKRKIILFMDKINACKMDNSIDNSLVDTFVINNGNPLTKKEPFYKDIKLGAIDKNKVTTQKTPKAKDNMFFKKDSSLKLSKFPNKNPNISLKKKTQSEKQNIQTFIIPKLMQRPARDLSLKPRSGRRSQPINKSAEKCQKQESITIEKQEIANQYFQFMDDQLFSPTAKMHIKTESDMDNSMRMKQFSLQDLQKEMNEQVTRIKYEKKLSKLEPELSNLFRSIIRYNPPRVSKIDPRYACFEDLSEQTIKALHQFLVNLRDDELNSLEFDNFKKLIIKYRADNLLDSLK